MLRIPLPEFRAIQSAACELEWETCAVGYSLPVGSRDHVVRHFEQVPEDAYVRRTATSATLRSEYCIEVANRARSEGAGVVLAHTHVGQSALQGFSSIDDDGERLLSEYFQARVPKGKHFACLFTPSSVYARELGNTDPIVVRGIGRSSKLAEKLSGEIAEQFDRQVRAFGKDGQRVLKVTSVAIVGLGGTGSVIAQQLAYLGITRFVLIDFDTVEASNLNRIVGATRADVGVPKVKVSARLIRSIDPLAECTEVIGDVVDSKVTRILEDVDFIFGCTDSMASRAVLNQIAYQYLIPTIDIGVGILVSDGAIEYITGRTQMLAPGLPCMVCTEKLDAEQVRRELLSEEMRKADPYITGATLPQPAVISLNSTMSSAAITMFLSAIAGIPSEARMVIYDGIRGSLRPAAMQPRPQCIVCSYDGALARGSTWDLPMRADG